MRFMVILLGLCTAMPAIAAYRAAVNSAVITPSEAMWAGGYAARNAPVSEKVHDLWAKALILEDASGERFVLITADLIGLTPDISEFVASELQRHYNLPRNRFVITCSHTHSGPALAGVMSRITYPVDDAQYAIIERYTEHLKRTLVDLVRDAWDRLEPAQLAYGIGETTFAVNRRNNPEGQVGQPGYTIQGPVDHDVPVLRVSDGDGSLKAVFFVYACHCTTMDFLKWCGDYAGFAQAYLEEQHPEVTAMFAAGCGGDINPIPRRDLELCKQYGRRLADAVNTVLASDMTPLTGPIRASMTRISLLFHDVPRREALERELDGDNVYYARRARFLLERLDSGNPLPDAWIYPIQVVQFGGGLTSVFLGGEVVVDYGLRLKAELGPERTFVVAYANDVPGYIPSERVLAEGGYEGGGSMVYYGLPARWAAGLEQQIIDAVHALVRDTASNATAAP